MNLYPYIAVALAAGLLALAGCAVLARALWRCGWGKTVLGAGLGFLALGAALLAKGLSITIGMIGGAAWIFLGCTVLAGPALGTLTGALLGTRTARGGP